MTNRQNLAFMLIGLVAVIVFSSTFTVDQRERALLFQLGEIRGTDFPPGTSSFRLSSRLRRLMVVY